MEPYKTIISTSFHVFIDKVDVLTETADTTLLPPCENSWLKLTNTAFTATPIKIIRKGLRPDFHDKENTNKKAIAPPIKANNGAKKYNAGKKNNTIIVTKPAPEEIPI